MLDAFEPQLGLAVRKIFEPVYEYTCDYREYKKAQRSAKAALVEPI